MEAETKTLFKGESSGTSSSEATSSSLLAKASRLISQLKSEPCALTERHTKKRKRGKMMKWSRDFQKNLVVIDFQGLHPSQYRTLRDYEKVYEGALTLTAEMSEEEVKREIVRLVKMKKSTFHSFDELVVDDIEFVKCVNRRIRIPDGSVNYDGEGIKSLYRSGAIYVRLKRSCSNFDEKVHIINAFCNEYTMLV